jgi:hypothetical protein
MSTDNVFIARRYMKCHDANASAATGQHHWTLLICQASKTLLLKAGCGCLHEEVIASLWSLLVLHVLLYCLVCPPV